jgi:hypothetical protein
LIFDLIFDFPKTKEKWFVIFINESQNTVIQQTLLATNTASTSFDLLVEYIEPGTPKVFLRIT